MNIHQLVVAYRISANRLVSLIVLLGAFLQAPVVVFVHTRHMYLRMFTTCNGIVQSLHLLSMYNQTGDKIHV